MKGSRALFAGILVGIIIGLIATPLGGLEPLEITLSACVALFAYTSLCLIFFSVHGWPNSSSHTDFYDLSRIYVGAALTLMAAGIISAASEKLASLLLIEQGLAAILATLFLICYCTMAYALIVLVRKPKQRSVLSVHHYSRF